MRTLVLVRRPSDDYSTLPPYEFIFDEVPSVPTAHQLEDYKNRLIKITDEVSKEDTIVFNGPTWLIALASYYWFTRRAASDFNLNVLLYNIGGRRYEPMQPCLL